MKRSHPGETGLSRVMAILQALDDAGRGLSRGEVIRRAGLPPASGYRLLREMAEHGLIDLTDNRVEPGLRLWELGARSSRIERLRRLALPMMMALQEVHRHHTQLSVLDGTDVLCIQQLSSDDPVAILSGVGGRVPARLVTPGIVLAAFADQATQRAVIATPATVYTRHTPRTGFALRRELAHAKKTGYARADGWVEETVVARGVPVRAADGRVIAALSVVLPADRRLVAKTLPAVQSAAAQISRSLRGLGGGVPPSGHGFSALTH